MKFSVIALMFALLVSGCGGLRNMALAPDVTSVDTSKESIALLTVRVANKYKPRYQPEPWGVGVKGLVPRDQDVVYYTVGEPFYERAE